MKRESRTSTDYTDFYFGFGISDFGFRVFVLLRRSPSHPKSVPKQKLTLNGQPFITRNPKSAFRNPKSLGWWVGVNRLRARFKCCKRCSSRTYDYRKELSAVGNVENRIQTGDLKYSSERLAYIHKFEARSSGVRALTQLQQHSQPMCIDYVHLR